MNTTAERIAYAIAQSKKKPVELAREIGISAARISQLMNASGSIKAEHLYRFSKATGFAPQWIAEGVGEQSANEDLSASYAMIPQLTAKGSAGEGHTNFHVEVRGELAFKRDWLARMGLKHQYLKVIYNTGDSMHPTLSDGDVLLIDEFQTWPVHAKIFAILRPDGDVSIKRLIHSTVGGWVIRSDNDDKRQYPDEQATDTEIGHLKILGRVVWHGGAL